MTLHHQDRIEVGVRELHDQLSHYLRHVADGGEVLVTLRGRHIARLSGINEQDPLAELRDRGLVSEPTGNWQPRPQPIRGNSTVSDLVAEQRR